MKRLWVIAYDIADDRARRQVERILQGWGDRVQYSVFEVFMTQPQARRLQALLAPLIDADTDSLRFYPLCAWCQADHLIFGQGRRSDDPALLVV